MSQNAVLIVSQPGRGKRIMDVSEGRTSIGRAPDNAVSLEGDTDVSRYHAAIENRGDGFWLSDLGSRNGTSVNDDPVESERKLDDGDLICVGGASVIEFCSPDAVRKYASAAAGAPPAHLPFAPGGAVPAEKESFGGGVPSPPPESRQPSGKSLVNVAGAVGGLVLTAVVMAILFAAGAFEGKKSPQTSSPRVAPQPQTGSAPFGDEIDPSLSDPPPQEPAEESEVTEAFEGSPRPTPGAEALADADGVAGAARVLAAKISPKNYQFDATFVRLIGSYVNEYKSARGYYERARKYRDAIDKEFVNVQGIPPLFGYAMAMSQSKFVEEGGGVWRLPAPVVKDEAVDSQTSDPAGPANSTKIAASYIRGLWDTFGRDGFMYAVACYGMTQDEAGEVEQRLGVKDPGGQARYDFWKMKNAGVVKGEGIERVARFFAAGIVMENPQQFGLNEQPLSSLY